MKHALTKTAAVALLAAAGMAGVAGPAQAAEEQFVPLLVYRTGSFAPLGIGSAFPCTILLAFALLLTSWRERPRAIAPKEHRTIARPVV